MIFIVSRDLIKGWCHVIKRDNEEKDDEHNDGLKSPEYTCKDFEDSTMVGDVEIFKPWYKKCKEILVTFPSK